jgi:hypothetical protein
MTTIPHEHPLGAAGHVIRFHARVTLSVLLLSRKAFLFLLF